MKALFAPAAVFAAIAIVALCAATRVPLPVPY